MSVPSTALSPRRPTRGTARSSTRLALLLGACGVTLALARPPTPTPVLPLPSTTASVSAPEDVWTESKGARLVFFAVLEGLYLDGVQDEVVRVILDGPTPVPSPGLSSGQVRGLGVDLSSTFHYASETLLSTAMAVDRLQLYPHNDRP